MGGVMKREGLLVNENPYQRGRERKKGWNTLLKDTTRRDAVKINADSKQTSLSFTIVSCLVSSSVLRRYVLPKRRLIFTLYQHIRFYTPTAQM
jgi:hypothetical protein